TELEAAKSLVQELEAAESAEIAKLDELQLVDPALSVRRAKADVNAKRARRAQARQGVDECALRSPCAGTVLRVLVRPGEVLGSRPRHAAVLVSPAVPRRMPLDLSLELVGLVGPDQTAAIHYEGRVPAAWRGRAHPIRKGYRLGRSLT